MEKLLAIVSLVQNIYGRWLFRQLLSRIILIMSLAIVTSMMTGALIISAFYVAYLLLQQYAGYNAQTALTIVGSTGVALTAVIFMLTVTCMRRLRQVPQEMLKKKTPTVAQATDVIDGFLEGFLKEPKKTRK